MVVDTQQIESPTSSSRVGLRWGPETLEVRDQEVFGTGDADLCRRFLHRVFSVDEVKSVQIDRRRSSAVIRYERGRGGLAELLQRLATAIRVSGLRVSNSLVCPTTSASSASGSCTFSISRSSCSATAPGGRTGAGPGGWSGSRPVVSRRSWMYLY